MTAANGSSVVGKSKRHNCNAQRARLMARLSTLASAECRLPESLHFTECDVILGVVRARSVHKIGYGHNRDWSAA